jgi:DNA-binding XRE family transcriptional regulator
MKNEQQKQAENLYFQTDLSKTEIAKTIGVSRRSVHYWVHDNNWEYIKKCTQTMPVQLAQNCYFIMAKLQESILSGDRAGQPVTMQEVNAMYKLTMTINKLKDRSTLSENLQVMAGFMEHVKSSSPVTAAALQPVVNDYIDVQARKQSSSDMPPNFSARGHIPVKQEDHIEAMLDLEDIKAWAAEEATQREHSPAQTRSAPTANANEEATKNTEKMQDMIPGLTNPQNMPKGQAINRAARRKMERMAASRAA